jgi:hypothetical protein
MVLVRLIRDDDHVVYMCKQCFDAPIEALSPSEMRAQEMANSAARRGGA